VAETAAQRDVIEILTQDHREVESTFVELEALSVPVDSVAPGGSMDVDDLYSDFYPGDDRNADPPMSTAHQPNAIRNTEPSSWYRTG
jgi:hypothetical protein